MIADKGMDEIGLFPGVMTGAGFDVGAKRVRLRLLMRSGHRFEDVHHPWDGSLGLEAGLDVELYRVSVTFARWRGRSRSKPRAAASAGSPR